MLATGQSLSVAFSVDPVNLGPKPVAVVPPMQVRPTAEGDALSIQIGCYRSSREELAQLSLAETDQSVTVSAVTLVPVEGLGCDATRPARDVVLPLNAPLAGRAVVVVPTSTKLPPLDLSDIQGN